MHGCIHVTAISKCWRSAGDERRAGSCESSLYPGERLSESARYIACCLFKILYGHNGHPRDIGVRIYIGSTLVVRYIAVKRASTDRRTCGAIAADRWKSRWKYNLENNQRLIWLQFRRRYILDKFMVHLHQNLTNSSTNPIGNYIRLFASRFGGERYTLGIDFERRSRIVLFAVCHPRVSQMTADRITAISRARYAMWLLLWLARCSGYRDVPRSTRDIAPFYEIIHEIRHKVTIAIVRRIFFKTILDFPVPRARRNWLYVYCMYTCIYLVYSALINCWEINLIIIINKHYYIVFYWESRFILT